VEDKKMVSNETHEALQNKIEKLKNEVSRLKGIEQSLKRERDFIYEVLYWTDSLVIVVDLKGYIVTFNRSSEKLSGYRFEEVREKPFWDILISTEEREGVKTTVTDVSEKGLPNKFQNYWITKDGSKRLISWVNSILRNPDGSIEYILCNGRDITEQKKAEEALRKSEEKYRELVQHANSIILRFDIHGRIIFFNEFAQSFFGYTEDEIIGRNIIGTIVPQTESSGRDLKAMAGDIIRNPSRYVQNENENIRHSGERVWIAWTNKAIFDHAGKVSEILSIGMDITDRKRAEEALKLSEEKFSKVFQNSPAMISISTVNEGRFLEVNDRFTKILGFTREETVGNTSFDLGCWVDITRDRDRAMQIFRKQGYFRNLEVKMRFKDGKEHTMLWSADSIEFEGRECLINVVTDITEQKMMQEEKAALESRLQQAQKMEAIGTLAGGIAHDFNNILAAIFGYTELALTDSERESILYQNLQEVLRAGERAKDLVKQILTFSRQAEQERKPVQVKLICKEAIKFLRASLPTSITIRQKIESESLVMADPTQIHQVLMNLCTNAGHAMGNKGGDLGLTLLDVYLGEDLTAKYPELQPGPYIELTVSDTGYGMPAHVIERIFDPFFTTKVKGEGTGMGLSVVHGIVGSCGGTITASSKPGKGSTFKIYLPALERGKASFPIVGESISTGTEHILFIDDETALANIGKQMLEPLGYKVTTRTSSIEALELFKTRADSFDLVITDMTMPNMTGDQLARELIRIRPKVPVILCTGYTARITKEQALALGIRAFVPKPVLRKEIAETIRMVLDEK
jgi:PAS domain S-box-containing protein